MGAKRKQKDFLFVYGTLRKAAAHRVHDVLARYSEPVSKAMLKAKLYDLGQYPGAILSQNPEDVVTGELYALDPKHSREALAALDEYEGITEGTTPEYRREKHVVTLEDGRQLRAWVYLYCRNPRGAEYIASGDYLAYRKSRRAGGDRDHARNGHKKKAVQEHT